MREQTTSLVSIHIVCPVGSGEHQSLDVHSLTVKVVHNVNSLEKEAPHSQEVA